VADRTGQREDLPILCERFTTSKLQRFEDLSSIATYGFRGEALASISHIAHLTVTTKTKASNNAWRAHYDGGKLVPAKPGQTQDPKPAAGRGGTQIMVEDLFYNVPIRKRAFRSPSDEYNKIIDMVGRYAIHCSQVAFSCKKHGDSSTSIAVQTSATVSDRIRQIYGSAVASELIEFSISDDRWSFNAAGWATNANYHINRTTFLLFINHRCVESPNIRRAIEQTYSAFLPKSGHPWVYLSLEIDPDKVDVNVHPTKREVHFLHEDEIIQAVCEHIRAKLAEVDTSRTFTTQTLLPGSAFIPGAQVEVSVPPAKAASASGARRTPATTNTKQYENNLVRTDTNLRKITSMFQPAAAAGASIDDAEPADDAAVEYSKTDRAPTPCRLISVRELRAAVRDDTHHELTELLANHTFVGLVDDTRRLAAIQAGVKLYLIDYGRTCAEYVYQVGLTDFGNFGTINFSPPLSLRTLVGFAAVHEAADPATQEKLVDAVVERLVERREMLAEYFTLEVTPAGELVSIPLLIKGYIPSVAKLPRFLLRLGPHVDWTDEKRCFESFLRELAAFYAPEQLPPAPTEGEEADAEIEARRRHVRNAVEHVFFPAIKARLVGTKSLMNGGILEVANLKGLYRVFERC
jgi:DNA mismatch repair protein MLH1